jgi:hypothetical protein
MPIGIGFDDRHSRNIAYLVADSPKICSKPRQIYLGNGRAKRIFLKIIAGGVVHEVKNNRNQKGSF